MYLFKIYVEYNYKTCDDGLKHVIKDIYSTINILNSMSPDKKKYFGDKMGNSRHSFGLFKNGPHGLVSGIICEGFSKDRIEKLGLTTYNGKVAHLFDCFISDCFEAKQSKVTVYRAVRSKKDPNIKFYYVIKRISNNRGLVKSREAFTNFIYKANDFISEMKKTDTGEGSIEIDFI